MLYHVRTEECTLKKMALVLIILTLLASGCGSADVGPEPAPAPIAEHGVKHETVRTATSPTVYDDPTTYKYNSSDVRFVVVDYQHISDGTRSGITIKTLVDVETRVMYVLMEKFQAGYGLSIHPILDVDGSPLIYDKDF